MPHNETKLLYKTHGNALPGGKPRVYFTCHPADFESYFEKVCADLFAAHDCAVYYTEDMSGELPADTRETDLDRMNLFVIPVTTRLLVDENRAMDEDFAFAKEKHIPVLPLMMQPGLDILYSKEDRFGKLQYLDPFNTDSTAIPYKEKLKKYLEAVLVSDETVKRIRAAFDAYIFLSYRKKDRAFANTLMRLIHSHPLCRDIAVWYDEFLTPGESFNENIERALRDSRMFALLVTPNLLEETNGKPNFVMGTEYPAARDAGMDILPAEMQDTDRAALAEKFAGLPTPVKTEDEAAFTAALTEAVCRFAKDENDNDPAHNYLIGLAYLDGIDVETNRERGLELITSAAEADLPEAMVKLYDMYKDGTGVGLDYRKSLYWAKKFADYCVQKYGEEDKRTLTALNNLSVLLLHNGNYADALPYTEKCYALRCRIFGEEHPDTLLSLSNLAATYAKLGKHQKALELNKINYTLRCRIFGEEHPSMLNTLNNLAAAYLDLGEYKKALTLFEKCYMLLCKVLGEEHPKTLVSLSSLAVICNNLGNHKKALELNTNCYALRCKILGEEHPDTLSSLSSLALTYSGLGNYKKALELNINCYALRRKILGEEHPATLKTLSNLAVTFGNLGEYKKETELLEKCYTLRCKALGEEHPDTLTSLNHLAATYNRTDDHQKALELNEKCYVLRCKILGEEHPDTLATLNNLAMTYGKLGNFIRSRMLFEQCCISHKKVLGETHPTTLNTAANLAKAYFETGDREKAAEIGETLLKNADALRPNTRKKAAELFDALRELEKADFLRGDAENKA